MRKNTGRRKTRDSIAGIAAIALAFAPALFRVETAFADDLPAASKPGGDPAAKTKPDAPKDSAKDAATKPSEPKAAAQPGDSAKTKPDATKDQPVSTKTHVNAASIVVFPPKIVLTGPRDARRLIVTGTLADGSRVDLTSTADYEPSGDGCTVDSAGFLHAKKNGVFTLTIRAGGRSAEIPVIVQKSEHAEPVSFIRDVMPVISRVGCNAGTCHGSAKGKKGFKLSLRGYDPDFDYLQLVDDLAGRRFNRSAPEQSLMLLKPTASVPHEGGYVLDPDSPAYAILRDWIAEGVRSDSGKVARVASLEVYPPTIDLSMPGQSQQMVVFAHYPDGSTRDVTLDAIYSSSVPDIATVSSTGEATGVRRGEASILIRYEGVFGVDNVTVMGDRTGFVWCPMPEYNYIDKFVNKKLEKVKILPSPECGDAEFLRRVSLDLTGLPPTPERIRAFLADSTDSRTKRDRVIDELIASPEFTAHWTHKWADLFQVNRKLMGEKETWAFVRWIEESVAKNAPYDEMVRTIVAARGSSYDNPPVNYFRASKEPSVALENATQLFLGVRFSCNKCHDHPFERWTQGQYYGMAAFWGRTAVKNGSRPGEQIVYDRNEGEVTHPKDGRVVPPRFPYEVPNKKAGEQSSIVDESRRAALADWLTSAENPYFARSIANRIWSYFLGKGIIDPVDDIRSGNPPSNPELLDALEKDLIAHRFDLRYLMRTIARSRTYRASIVVNKFNEDDTSNFSHATPRRLTAEELMDAIDLATGKRPRFAGVPEGFRADQLPDSQIAAGGFLDLFGRPPRETPCECERSSEVSLSQALNLVNGPTIADALVDPNGRIAKLMLKNPDDKTIVDEMYLAAIGRFPTEAELAKARDYLAHAGSKAEGAQDLLWALINSPAFLFNR